MRGAIASALLLAGCASTLTTSPRGVDTGDDGPPALVMRARPFMAMAGQPVTIIAELTGREDERYYCPRVLWTMPDGTHSAEESDCPPWAERVDYPHRWQRVKRLASCGTDAEHCKYVFEVTLEKAGRVLMRQTLTVEVGG